MSKRTPCRTRGRALIMKATTDTVAPAALSKLLETTYAGHLPGVMYATVGSLDAVVRDITHDSSQVSGDSLFCCVVGDHTDGHEFAQAALDAGASALLVERELPLKCTQIVVADSRRAMGEISSAFYGHPSQKMRVVGITGTNGKTTTSHLLGAIFRQQGLKTEVFGTLSGVRTTPESCDLQRSLWQAANAGVEAVVMEVTSHALVLQRIIGTSFNAVVFLNLSPEHLDFHKTLEQYFAAKASLFDKKYSSLAIINRDDVHGQLLLDTTEINTVSFGLDDVKNIDVTAMSHSYVWRKKTVHVPVGGKFNVSNSLAAATVAASLGVDIIDIISGLAATGTVAGRFQSISNGAPFDVIVDYAHTPDALQRLLDTTREIITPGGKIILVFGCGGNRDKAKRPLMGAIAEAHADCVIVTSDNPRSEEPMDIAHEIISGIKHVEHRSAVIVELDRRSAIELAFMTARKGDVVIIAGKGHETTQTIGNQVLPFNDAQVANELIGAIS
ncbi:MAG: UDP-N-acetylmuramoyl-L-alanyl-D-glutamate--2,6-diaminopimelate ligase [Actinobacteria bacterium]|nr:UDP-N-acetylmuramoyl-L-alanyl-D-glutamate--2,6-diaminopimelate ligase [Actinomycetota bacterium]